MQNEAYLFGEWHRWFAWYPTPLGWLKWIERRKLTLYSTYNEEREMWVYREIKK